MCHTRVGSLSVNGYSSRQAAYQYRQIWKNFKLWQSGPLDFPLHPSFIHFLLPFRYDGLCDKDGCDLNSWRMGDRTFFGPGSNFKVDSTKPMTVVTQFITRHAAQPATARPRSQFLHSCERFYIFPGLVCLFGYSKIGRPILKIY
jgi:hypothetical protein